MKVETLRATELLESGRLDSGYYLSAGRLAAASLLSARESGLVFKKLGQPDGIGEIWQPDRFKRAYAAPNEDALPYLRPYDVFGYLPVAADFLSIRRNRGIDTYRLKSGMILQSCSGRNLGPAVIVDHYLEQFIIGDDMLRIEIPDDALRYYVLAFLKTSVAQQLLRQGKTGSVIDHISEEHVAGLQIPLLETEYFNMVSEWMTKAVHLQERSRLTLAEVQSEYEAALPPIESSGTRERGWTLRAANLTGRLDAASYDPLVVAVRKALTRAGGRRVSEVATVLKPPGRYKTIYVSAQHGSPIVSGTQLLQHTLINLQYLAHHALRKRDAYALRSGWIAYQADGRAEEALGLPVMVTPDREGWLASGHVGRVIANNDVNRGWLYAALRTPQAQLQLKALASGSVVDATFPSDMESVVLPPKIARIEWDRVSQAWDDFAQVADIENKAIHLLEDHLAPTIGRKGKN
jgi:hypothetical protein